MIEIYDIEDPREEMRDFIGLIACPVRDQQPQTAASYNLLLQLLCRRWRLDEFTRLN